VLAIEDDGGVQTAAANHVLVATPDWVPIQESKGATAVGTTASVTFDLPADSGAGCFLLDDAVLVAQ
jgi:hypothetical protein